MHRSVYNASYKLLLYLRNIHEQVIIVLEYYFHLCALTIIMLVPQLIVQKRFFAICLKNIKGEKCSLEKTPKYHTESAGATRRAVIMIQSLKFVKILKREKYEMKWNSDYVWKSLIIDIDSYRQCVWKTFLLTFCMTFAIINVILCFVYLKFFFNLHFNEDIFSRCKL